MSHTAPLELKVLVERVVRPLPITIARQRRLRSEYLAHLEAIYAEELQRDQAPAAALARTIERFGDPAAITAELRETVDWCERWGTVQERWVSQQPDESTAGYAMRLVACSLAGLLPLLALVVLTRHAFDVRAISLLEVRLIAGFAAFVVVFLGGFLALGLSWGQEWLRPSRSGWRLAAYSMGLAVAWPVALGLMMAIAGGNWDEYANPKLPVMVLLGAGAALTFVCGPLIGVLHQRDVRYRREWARMAVE